MNKTHLKKLHIADVISNKVPRTFQRTHNVKHNHIQVLNIDIEKNPELLDLIYRPIESKDVAIPTIDEIELIHLMHYDDMKPDLIYRPYSAV